MLESTYNAFAITFIFCYIFYSIYKYIGSSSQNRGRFKKPKTKVIQEPVKERQIKVKENQIYEYATRLGQNNVVSRHLQESCHKLHEFDMNTHLNTKSIELSKNKYFTCYGCGQNKSRTHPVYVFSCRKCGNLNQKMRYFSRDLTGQVAFVTGARTKLGHQIVLKLLRAGATVIGTTRSPDKAFTTYREYSDYDSWQDRLDVYPKPVDLDNDDLDTMLKEMRDYIFEKYGRLDILVNCAAQTIRIREKGEKVLNTYDENRYGDAKFVESTHINSWQMSIADLEQREMEEVYRVNAIAPALIVQTFLPLLNKSKVNPYIINVHAKEGLIDVSHKSKYHIHLNMGKSALHMLTRGLIDSQLETDLGKKFCIHGTDPGWISVDEYYEETRPWIVPPLDEIDGAAGILYPLFAQLSSCRKTRRHYTLLTY